MVLGFGEGEITEEGRYDWAGAMLPNTVMRTKIAELREEGQAGPFLLAMGSLRGVTKLGGIGNALFGVALAADTVLGARMLLGKRHFERERNLNDNGEFRWPYGVPLIRIWLCDPPVPFVDFTGSDPTFSTGQASTMLGIDRLVPGMSENIGRLRVREIGIDRAEPLPPAILRPLEWREGTRTWREVGSAERDPEARRAALDANIVHWGTLRCEMCSYEPSRDKAVPKGYGRSMMDVHHRVLLATGERITTLNDLMVLCPTCHRRAHVQERAAKTA
jgi:hypothetical protein